jgi:hypothetical protein
MVYRPKTTGTPAICAYPITSGIASAARVIPAIISNGTCDFSRGRIPWRTENFPNFWSIVSSGGIICYEINFFFEYSGQRNVSLPDWKFPVG